MILINIKNKIMWQIVEKFDDYTHPTGKGTVLLNANKDMNPYTLSYPITWTGYINDTEVIIIQKTQSALVESDFDFIEFPEIYSFLKGFIPDWVHKALSTLN
jgi:hypothetical protein